MLEILADEEDLDGLNYLATKNMDFVNKKAYQGTLMAHLDGGVPCMTVNIPKMMFITWATYFLKKLVL